MSRAAVVARNSLFGLVALGVDKIAFMAIVLALARHLGTAEFGRYAFVMAYLGVFQIMADLGLEMILVRRAARQPSQRDQLLANGLAIRLTSGAGFWIVALLVLPLVADASYSGLVLIAGSFLVSTTWTIYKVLYRSAMRIEYLAMLTGFNAVANGTAVALVIVRGADLFGAVAGVSAATATTLPFAMWLGRRYFRPRLRFQPALWLDVIRDALPLGLNAVLVSLSLRIGPLLLVRLKGAEEVAYFSAAAKLVEAFCLMAEVPMLTIFPLMSALGAERRARLASFSRAATKWLVILMLPVVLVAGSMAEAMLTVMYGAAFASAAGTLKALVWAAAFAATGAVWIGVLTALGLQRLLLAFYVVGTVVNVSLALALIPRFGSAGAGLAAVIATGVSQALLIWLPVTAPYIRPAAAGVLPAMMLAAALALFVPWLSLAPLPSTALALALYAAGVLLTGTVGAEERDLARRVVQGIGGGKAW